MRTLVHVVTSSESAARDASAIAAGTPSRALMQRAGAAAASEIALRYREQLASGVLVLAGPGNNGGDGWVIARALGAVGVRVRVVEPVEAKTDDARAERTLALEQPGVTASTEPLDGGEALVVDALLGTGATGAPRGAIASVIGGLESIRSRGATIVAVDVPSGMDASTGVSSGCFVHAHLTLTFGTAKRGHLVNRGACGDIVVLDIGLGAHSTPGDGAPQLVDEAWVGAHVPAIDPSAHKGTRKKVAIIGGANGMAGAAILAARSALRSGAGMVKLIVAPTSLSRVQEAEPYALAASWPLDDAGAVRDIASWADVVIIGPGLGRTTESEDVLRRVLHAFTGPTLLDADAITLFEGRRPELAHLLAGRQALLTPHPAEFARLSGDSVDHVLATRFEAARSVSSKLGAAVLLKGVPTVITAPDGRRLVSASGTPALATAGSGDVLSGIAGTLLGQSDDPLVAGAVAAWVHGRAAERVSFNEPSVVRGIVLDDIVNELRRVWTFDTRPSRYPVLAELPNVGPG